MFHIPTGHLIPALSSILKCCLQKFKPFAWLLNSFLASGYICRLLITFENRLDPDQDRQNVGPDLDPNRLTLIVLLKDFFKKDHFEKCQQTTTKA